MRHLDKGLPAERCSTGEQKALLIALVLADARLQARDRASPPLLLLDEVAAHLDDRHRRALFDEIADLGTQAWLTRDRRPGVRAVRRGGPVLPRRGRPGVGRVTNFQNTRNSDDR